MELNRFLMLRPYLGLDGLLVEHILALSFDECQSLRIYGCDRGNAIGQGVVIEDRIVFGEGGLCA